MDTAAYYHAAVKSDALLEETQRNIRAAEDVGEITVREAADLRVRALVEHLAACREARRRFLNDWR